MLIPRVTEGTRMPAVYNKNTHVPPPGAVYIGRGLPWGNPARIVRGVVSRAEAVEAFHFYLDSRPDLVERIRTELRGKDLVCFCAPAACHGDIILEIANEHR